MTVEDSSMNKEPHEVVPNQAEDLESAALIQEQSKTSGQEIKIQIYPNNQGISLVTRNILSTDVASFSSQVPAILTEGDAEDSETHYQVINVDPAVFIPQTIGCHHPETKLKFISFIYCCQVVTTSSMLNQGDGSASLDALTSSTDFSRNMILTEQQQVLLSGMLVPGVTANQAVHINMTHDTSACIDVDEMSQDGQVWKYLFL